MAESSQWDKFHSLTGGETQIKALRQVINYLMTFIGSPDSSSKDIAAIVSSDPALATQVLTVVNSAALGLRQHVSDLKLAVTLIGSDSLRDIVLNIAIMEKIGRVREVYMTRLWEHSFYCAKASGIIAGSLGRLQGEAFTVGLLHDIGKILLCYANHQAFTTAMNNYRYHKGSIQHWESEKHVLGLSHAEIGAMACLEMKIPEAVCKAIWSHHSHLPAHSASADDYLARIIHMADRLCWVFGHPSVNTVNPFLNKPPEACIDDKIYLGTGLSKERFRELIPKIKTAFTTGEAILEAIHSRRGPGY